MEEKQGWIKLYRKTLDNPIVCKDSETFSVWIYLLLNATHSDYDTFFKGKRIKLKCGQLITGRESISKKLKINESKVQRILKLLENEQQIEQQTSNKNRLITIVNWDMYQNNEQQIEQQLNNKRTTTEQQLNTNKNIKNNNNDNNIENNTCAQNFDKFWKAYPKKRDKGNAEKWFKKHKPSEELTNLMIKQIERFKDTKDWKKQDGQFIPYPTTWLNAKMWEDEFETETEQEERIDREIMEGTYGT